MMTAAKHVAHQLYSRVGWSARRERLSGGVLDQAARSWSVADMAGSGTGASSGRRPSSTWFAIRELSALSLVKGV